MFFLWVILVLVVLDWMASRYRVMQLVRVMEIYRKAAHDLRSPLSVLRMAVEPGSGMTPQSQIFKDSLSRTDELCVEILNHGELSPARNTLSGEMVDSIARQVVEEKRFEYSRHCDLKLEFLSGNLYGEVTGVGITLARALSNLINNAVEACGGKGEVRVSTAMTHTHLILHVEDSGVGYWETDRPGVRRNATKTTSLGIGLKSAERWVRGWGGELQILSRRPQRGTVVSVRLKLLLR